MAANALLSLSVPSTVEIGAMATSRVLAFTGFLAVLWIIFWIF